MVFFLMCKPCSLIGSRTLSNKLKETVYKLNAIPKNILSKLKKINYSILKFHILAHDAEVENKF